MKIVKEEKKYTVEVYEAIDGTRFSDKAECEIYEKSAKCLLLSKYNKLVIKKDFEYNIFGCGSEDDYVDIVKILCKEDIDVIMQTLGVISSYMLKEDYKERYDKCQDILVKAWNEGDLVFIYRGYDNNSFSIEETLSNRITNIAKACECAISYKLTKLDNEAN